MSFIVRLLRRLSRNDATFLLHRAYLRAGYGNRVQRLANRDMFNRPEWFWGANPVPNLPVARPASTDGLSTDAKKALAGDLIDSFHLGQQLDPSNDNQSPLWATIIDQSAVPVLDALRRKDCTALVTFLEAMFPSPTLWGIGYGDLGVTQQGRFASFLILHQLVGLAEYLGIARTECPEQGEIGHALREGPAALLHAVENAIGIRVDFPRISGSYGIEIDGRLLDMQTPGHLYAALRFKRALESSGRKDPPTVLEIGAGFGGTAFWFLKLLAPARYVVLDLPLTNVYQGWFLANALGRDRVGLYCDFKRDGRFGGHSIQIMPANSQSEFPTQRFDGVLNQDSFPEMPHAAVEGYVRLARERLDGILYSYNQEAFSPIDGKAPPRVRDVVAKVGGLERVSRELSWVRRGYVEEVFRPQP